MRPQSRVRKLNFRAVLVILTLLIGCLVIGKRTIYRARHQSRAVTQVERTMGSVQYEYHFAAPQWCVDLFGPDLFASVVAVSYFESGAYPSNAPEVHRNYSAFRQLPHLEEITVFDSYFPLDVLGSVSKLTRLVIEQNGLRDEDIEPIAELRNLRVLKLPFNDITDAGSRALANLTNLTQLDLSGNYVSEEGVADLRRALPHCQIISWHRRDGRY